MFVRVKKIGDYEYLYLVENAREGGRHVQRVVKALGAATKWRPRACLTHWSRRGAIQTDAAYVGDSNIDRGLADGDGDTQRRGVFGNS